jgi:hypothetical protein
VVYIIHFPDLQNESMNNLLSNFVHKVQARQLGNLQRKTKKLDPANREYLKNIITNGTDEHEDDDHHDKNQDEEDFIEEHYVLSQRDLDKANIRLEELESKRLFLQTRLQTYQSKISNAEEFIINNSADNNSSNISEDRLAMIKEKVKNQKTSLEPVEDFYNQIVNELSAHTSKIELMQLRQLDLKFKTLECNVVLHELSYGTGETNVVANTIIGNDETSELGLIVNNSENTSDCLLPDDGHKLIVPDMTVENASKEEEEEEEEEKKLNGLDVHPSW